MPNLSAVRSALDEFRAAVQCARGSAEELSGVAAARLHAEMVRMVDAVAADRDAVLSLARLAGATWERLEAESCVPDSTLSDRLARWETNR